MSTSGALRTLGAPVARKSPVKPKLTKSRQELHDQAIKTLRKEFNAALALKQKVGAEAQVGGKEKGRDAHPSDKLRLIVASLEGMNRFALAMNLITPQESRVLFAGAMKKGLYEGWRA
ncbi:MAG: hypothetical protein ACYDCC_04135 [Actinomycetota bacterium]